MKNNAIQRIPPQVSKTSERSLLLLSKGGHDEKGSRDRDVTNRHYTALNWQYATLKWYEPQVTRKCYHLASFSEI